MLVQEFRVWKQAAWKSLQADRSIVACSRLLKVAPLKALYHEEVVPKVVLVEVAGNPHTVKVGRMLAVVVDRMLAVMVGRTLAVVVDIRKVHSSVLVAHTGWTLRVPVVHTNYPLPVFA